MKNYIQFGDRKILPKIPNDVAVIPIRIIESESEFKNQKKEYFHTLVDNMGANSMWLSILLPVGDIFIRDKGVYRVEQHYIDEGRRCAYCEKLHLIK